MSDHPRIRNLRSVGTVLETALTSLSSNPVIFTLLSLLLFSFRSAIETRSYNATYSLIREVYRRPTVNHIDIPSPASPAGRELIGPGALDTDLSSEATASGPTPSSPLNQSLINPANGVEPEVNDNDDGLLSSSNNSSSQVDMQQDVDEQDTPPDGQEISQDREVKRYHDRAVEFVITRLGLGRFWAEILISLITFATSMLGFLLTYSCALGAVYIVTVNDLTGRFDSVVRVLWDGSRLSHRRLYFTILWHWAVRDLLSRLLGLWFFRRAKGFQALIFMMRMELVPFSGSIPWHAGYNREISAFLSAWYVTDAVIGCVFAVEMWIAIVEWRKRGREIIQESYHLASTSFKEAVCLRFLDCFLCGISFRHILSQSFGDVFAAIFQSAMEVYFMVVWLFFYLRFRCRHPNNSPGGKFELKELEEAFQGMR